MSSLVDSWLAQVQSQLGHPYVYGDEGPTTFDCSGLVQYTLGLVGVKAPRVAADQQKWATRVDTPQAGDLVFLGDPAYHVGIYVGAGKMIDAAGVGKGVRVDSVSSNATFGRVPGLGVGSLSSVLGGVSSAVGDWVSQIFGPAKELTFTAIAVVAGVALVGAGLWRLGGRDAYRAATGPQRKTMHLLGFGDDQ